MSKWSKTIEATYVTIFRLAVGQNSIHGLIPALVLSQIRRFAEVEALELLALASDPTKIKKNREQFLNNMSVVNYYLN